MGLRQETTLWAKEEPVEGPCFTLFWGAGVEYVGVATLLVAIDSTGEQVNKALEAHHLVAVVFLGQLGEGRLNDVTPQVKHQVQGGFFLDIVV